MMKCRVCCLLLMLAGAGTATAQQSGSITGRVFVGRADSAVTALVSIDEGVVNLQTDAQGRFHFDNVLPGKHAVVAKRIGYAPVRQVVRVRAGVIRR